MILYLFPVPIFSCRFVMLAMSSNGVPPREKDERRRHREQREEKRVGQVDCQHASKRAKVSRSSSRCSPWSWCLLFLLFGWCALAAHCQHFIHHLLHGLLGNTHHFLIVLLHPSELFLVALLHGCEDQGYFAVICGACCLFFGAIVTFLESCLSFQCLGELRAGLSYLGEERLDIIPCLVYLHLLLRLD